MSDQELLEAAAKSVGLDYRHDFGAVIVRGIPGKWNPLEDDGDALRLAVSLNMALSIHDQHCMACAQTGTMQTVRGIPTAEAIRRAIVRAAAEIARGQA